MTAPVLTVFLHGLEDISGTTVSFGLHPGSRRLQLPFPVLVVLTANPSPLIDNICAMMFVWIRTVLCCIVF